MEGASYMRLHRSQGLQGSALVRLYFLAAGPYGSAAIFLLRRMSALVGGVGLRAKIALAGQTSAVWVPSERGSVALELDCG
jgi:hypothetical protein